MIPDDDICSCGNLITIRYRPFGKCWSCHGTNDVPEVGNYIRAMFELLPDHECDKYGQCLGSMTASATWPDPTDYDLDTD